MIIDDFPKEGERTVTTIEMNFRLLEVLQEWESAEVTELADELSLTKSAVHKHLTIFYKLGTSSKREAHTDLGLVS